MFKPRFSTRTLLTLVFLVAIALGLDGISNSCRHSFEFRIREDPALRIDPQREHQEYFFTLQNISDQTTIVDRFCLTRSLHVSYARLYRFSPGFSVRSSFRKAEFLVTPFSVELRKDTESKWP